MTYKNENMFVSKFHNRFFCRYLISYDGEFIQNVLYCIVGYSRSSFLKKRISHMRNFTIKRKTEAITAI